jgi:hypothetical protein
MNTALYQRLESVEECTKARLENPLHIQDVLGALVVPIIILPRMTKSVQAKVKRKPRSISI